MILAEPEFTFALLLLTLIFKKANHETHLFRKITYRNHHYYWRRYYYYYWSWSNTGTTMHCMRGKPGKITCNIGSCAGCNHTWHNEQNWNPDKDQSTLIILKLVKRLKRMQQCIL